MPEAITYSERESQICFLENSLELDIIARNNDNLFDQLTLLPYYEEDGGESEGEKKDTSKAASGILDKIAAGIRAIIEKIQSILRGAMRAISNLGKDHLTYDKYKSTDKGKADLDARIDAIKKDIDQTFLDARPIVKAISNIFKMDPDTVREGCDKIIGRVSNANWTEGIKGLLSYGHEKLAAVKGYEKTIEGANSRLDASVNELSMAKMENNVKKDKMSALNEVGKMLGTLTNSIFGGLGKSEKEDK